MHPFTARFALTPARSIRRLRRGLVDTFHDINTAQRIVFESYQVLDRHLLDPPDSYLHWEPGMPGWQLRGKYLPPGTAKRHRGAIHDGVPTKSD